ncbi:MAG: phosphate uptake regulator, PhoU [archaeon YNP-WB-062]|nr:phosphate uptake regulator, PhoU [Candidatus Culexarchaeum yellowstonense]
MSRIIDAGLEGLSSTLNRMGEMAYNAVSKSLLECLEGREAYNEIREISNNLLIMTEYVEDRAFELIVRYQPVASDLRRIKSYMKIAYDLTRFGRYALDISFTNKRLGGLRDCEEWIKTYIRETGGKVLEMIRLSMEALKNNDPKLARNISTKENEVDKMQLEFLDKLIESETTRKCAISSVLIMRYLERIADHAAYICESIIYIATGQKETLR